MKSKLAAAEKKVVKLNPVTGDLRKEIAVKVAQVKHYQKQVEASNQQLEQVRFISALHVLLKK